MSFNWKKKKRVLIINIMCLTRLQASCKRTNKQMAPDHVIIPEHIKMNRPRVFLKISRSSQYFLGYP